MLNKLTEHWPEYLMEAGGLGTFMVSACIFATILESQGSPIRQSIDDPVIRRGLMGTAMGLTAIGIIYLPWGKQSGAHINPTLGVLLIAINYVVTIPGTDGTGIAFLAELVISFILMSVVLVATNTQNLARWTGLFAGIPVATYITVEAPLSGMSMNPAHTFAAALPAQLWTALWVYFAAPIVGMLLAAELYLRLKGAHEVFSAKLHHQNNKRGIFKCGYPKVTEPVVESKRPPENGQEPKMGYVNSVLMGVSKCPNPTVFQKTLSLNDFYLASKEWDYPMGHISFVGKLDRDTLRAGDPAIAPGFTLELMAQHSLDFWLTSEDLPDPNNRVTVDSAGNIVLSYQPNNEEAHKRLIAKLKDLMNHQSKCPAHGHQCHVGLFSRNLFLGQQIPLAGVAHQNGTIRFGQDPKSSALDSHCKAHELDNLYVMDASFFPSSGAVNPALTVMANALRVGDHLVERLK